MIQLDQFDSERLIHGDTFGHRGVLPLLEVLRE